MGKLIVTDGSGNSQEYLLANEHVTIGRHPDNDICVADRAVSGYHAAIFSILQDSFLEDLGSTNGTIVNGKPITKHALSHGDVITLGHNTLRYEEDSQPKQIAETSNAQTAITFPSSGKPMLGRLRVATGPKAGKELELTKTLTTIGRPGVQVAAITRRTDGYYIVHVEGHAGSKRPVVNGVEISTQARKLADNDSIEMAGTTMNFLLT